MMLERVACVCHALAGLIAVLGIASPAQAQSGLQIQWEVANRFRLFAEQQDFDRQVTAARAPDGTWKSVLDTEHTLEGSEGRGWSQSVRLCYDKVRNRVLAKCDRDGTVENYLNPQTTRIRLTAVVPSGFDAVNCTWTIGSGKPVTQPCDTPLDNERVSLKKATPVHLLAQAADGKSLQADASVAPRDVLVVGFGDSMAAGEGNPDKPIALSDQGFCFHRFLGFSTQNFYLPGRADADVVDDCPQAGEPLDDRAAWDRRAAGWLSAACHRSLYSYQMRTALALAVETPGISVTFIPLACTGATIPAGLLGPQLAHERPIHNNKPGPKYSEAQLSQLTNYLRNDNGKGLFRTPDLIFLTIGVNDIGFSGMVADITINVQPERDVVSALGLVSTAADAKTALRGPLKANFKKLRQALAKFTTTGDLSHIVFTTYGNPAVAANGQACPSSRHGFDAHPAFGVDGAKAQNAVTFVNSEFFPTLKDYATCQNGGCTAPAKQRMTFVDAHQAVFAQHGFCVTSADDPQFDRDCFKDGDSFNGNDDGLSIPLACTRNGSPLAPAFRPYAPRARWWRTVNDSYFVAMTYPAISAFADPADIHDALWGLTSVVYGGAIHPTAEGYSAMADAALPAARTIIGAGQAAPAAGVAVAH